jgi:hypothetical protein
VYKKLPTTSSEVNGFGGTQWIFENPEEKAKSIFTCQIYIRNGCSMAAAPAD